MHTENDRVENEEEYLNVEYNFISTCPHCGAPVYEMTFYNQHGAECGPPAVYYTCLCSQYMWDVKKLWNVEVN